MPDSDTEVATAPARPPSSAAASSLSESHEPTGSRAATAASTGTRPPTPPWQRKKRNKFLDNRVVADRFREEEDPAEAAARRRREAVTADFRDKDRPFQDVLDACLFGTAAERAAKATKALRWLRRPRTTDLADGSAGEGATLLPLLGDGGGGGGGAAAATAAARMDGIESANAWSADDLLNSHGYSLLGQAVVDKNHGAVQFLIVEAKASMGLHDANGA